MSRSMAPRVLSEAAMLVVILPLLVAIVGVLVYALSANAKVAEIGRLAYFGGILVTLWQCASRTLHL